MTISEVHLLDDGTVLAMYVGRDRRPMEYHPTSVLSDITRSTACYRSTRNDNEEITDETEITHRKMKRLLQGEA